MNGKKRNAELAAYAHMQTTGSVVFQFPCKENERTFT